MSSTYSIDSDTITRAIHISQMDCPTEQKLIRRSLLKIKGVKTLEFNLVQRMLTVSHEPAALNQILTAIRALGFTPELREAATPAEPGAPLSSAPRKAWWPLALAGLAALGAEGAAWLDIAAPWLPALCAISAIAISGLDIYRKGWLALCHRQLNINALISVAVTGALFLQQWPEAAMVMVLFAIAERIEAALLEHARHAISSLLAIVPSRATVRQADGSWLTVQANAVAAGAVVRLKPGERVPLDGQVLRGDSTVDQAPITGESIPVEKTIGDTLFAGTINQRGELEYSVTAVAKDSTLARIIRAIETAQSARAPTQRWVDRFAAIYTPAVFAVAVLTALAPPLLFGSGWVDAVYRSLVLLVIACPCALVISTPVTIVSGLAAAARRGILIKGGVYLEQGRHLAWLAFDKTGTITHGKPTLTHFERINASPDSLLDPHALAASLAARSDHPVSLAIAEAGQNRGDALLPVEHFEALTGYGVTGHINGHAYTLGSHPLIHQRGLCSEWLETRLNALAQQGQTTVLLADVKRVLAIFAVADTVKETSRQAMAELAALGVKTLMLSGDSPQTVQAIAHEIGIEQAYSNQLPEDKVAAIAKIAEASAGSRAKIGMVGDGMNDAPALARADIGFAMGAAGTDTAIETADVALIDDDLRKIPVFIRLARATSTVLTQNIVIALGIKGIFLALTAVGASTLWMAVFADMGASLLVVFNGLRLLRR